MKHTKSEGRAPILSADHIGKLLKIPPQLRLTVAELQSAVDESTKQIQDNRTDCGWRIHADKSKFPCHHCGSPTTGRNGSAGKVAVCYTCYHNITLNCVASRCGEPTTD